jgi:L-fuculose-phosphate aldolase
MPDYSSERDAARDILDAGRRLYECGLVAANDGNISVRVGDDAVLATPTNVSKGYMTHEMLVLLDLGGNVISGTYLPSSEIKMHLAIYRAAPDIRSVVHAHPTYATVFAVLRRGITGDELAETKILLGKIPVARYETPGTAELALGAAEFARDYKGCLLERHGAVTWGDSAQEALFNMERVEITAKVTYLAESLGV